MSKLLVETTLGCGCNLLSPLDWLNSVFWASVLTSLFVPATLKYDDKIISKSVLFLKVGNAKKKYIKVK